MIEIYTITFPDSTVYRYTSTVETVTFSAVDYAPVAGLVRGEVSVNPIELDSMTTLVMPCTDPVVRAYMESPPEDPVTVLIEQILNGDKQSWFVGVIASVSVSGVTAELRLVGEGVSGLSQATALRYTAQCRHALYGLACSVDITLHRLDGTLSDIEQNGLVLVSSDFIDADTTKWTGGAILIGDDHRTIIGQPATDKVRIDRAFIGIADSDNFRVFEGCNKTAATCRDKFNNLANFGGIPNLPRKNPFANDIDRSGDLP
jgi:uncharacterized phage protein (TIGR02218 family)